jgi:hypothetical protein
MLEFFYDREKNPSTLVSEIKDDVCL